MLSDTLFKLFPAGARWVAGAELGTLHTALLRWSALELSTDLHEVSQWPEKAHTYAIVGMFKHDK